MIAETSFFLLFPLAFFVVAFYVYWRSLCHYVRRAYPDIYEVASGHGLSMLIGYSCYRYIRSSIKNGLLAEEEDPFLSKMMTIERGILSFTALCIGVYLFTLLPL